MASNWVVLEFDECGNFVQVVSVESSEANAISKTDTEADSYITANSGWTLAKRNVSGKGDFVDRTDVETTANRFNANITDTDWESTITNQYVQRSFQWYAV